MEPQDWELSPSDFLLTSYGENALPNALPPYPSRSPRNSQKPTADACRTHAISWLIQAVFPKLLIVFHVRRAGKQVDILAVVHTVVLGQPD